MFGFFRKKKLRNLVAAHIATLMNGSLWSLRSGDAEKLAEKLLTDKFALGYIFGVAGAGLQVFGVSEAEERGLVLIAVFDSLFLENGLEIQNKCIDWAKKKDKLFLKGGQIGVDESSVFYKAMIAGDENDVKEAVGCLKTFDNHINAQYLQGNDT